MDALKDTKEFEVYKTRINKFKKFIKENKELFTWYGSPKLDGNYYKVTILNKYQFENWKMVTEYYKQNIAI